jgi:hypothetical protein
MHPEMAGVRFFDLPKMSSVRRKWLGHVRRDGLESVIAAKLQQNPKIDLRSYAVCSRHFPDGHPTVENPYPTLHSHNNFKLPKTTRRSQTSRSAASSIVDPAPDMAPTRKTIRLVKQHSKQCYPFIAGEVVVGDEATDHSMHIQGTCTWGVGIY